MAPSAVPTAANQELVNESFDGHGNGHTNGTNGQTKDSASDFSYPPSIQPDAPYRVLKQYHSKPTKLRVACIGAAVSGMCLAYKMEKQMVPGSWELTL